MNLPHFLLFTPQHISLRAYELGCETLSGSKGLGWDPRALNIMSSWWWPSHRRWGFATFSHPIFADFFWNKKAHHPSHASSIIHGVGYQKSIQTCFCIRGIGLLMVESSAAMKSKPSLGAVSRKKKRGWILRSKKVAIFFENKKNWWFSGLASQGFFVICFRVYHGKTPQNWAFQRLVVPISTIKLMVLFHLFPRDSRWILRMVLMWVENWHSFWHAQYFCEGSSFFGMFYDFAGCFFVWFYLCH